MRVAYLCADPGIPVFGTKGASVHVQEIIRAWRARGAEVRVYCTRTGDDVPADLADLTVTWLKVPQSQGPEREAAQAAAAAELAGKIIDDGADLVYERYSLFSTGLAQATAALGIPGILEVNAPLIDEQRTHRYLHDEAAAAAALRAQVAAADRTVCVSAPVARWVESKTEPAHPGGIAVVPNGVNTDRILPASPDPGAVPVVAFVGTLKPWHGVEVLLEAAALASQAWQLRIVGDGPLSAELQRRAAELGVAVDFTGAVVPEQIPAVLADCSLAAAPYPAMESDADQYFSPLKIYEYLAAALPVVASNVGQIPEIMDDGGTGLLVEPSDPAALAAAIDCLVAYPERRLAMSLAAREQAVARHSWHQVLEQSLAGIRLPDKNQELTV